MSKNMARVVWWKPIIKKFEERLSKWKVSLLSISAQSMLLKSMSGALGI